MNLAVKKFDTLCGSGDITLDMSLTESIKTLSHDRSLACFNYHDHGYVLRTESFPQSTLKVIPYDQYHLSIEGFAFLMRLRSIGINTPKSLFLKLHTVPIDEYTENALKGIYDEGPSLNKYRSLKKGSDCSFKKDIWKYRFNIFTKENLATEFFIAHALIKKQKSTKLKILPFTFSNKIPIYSNEVSGDLLLDMYDAMLNPVINSAEI